ncbi:MAG: alpha/beta hydrolase family protein [Bryobacteraceae bacterium]
MNRTRILPLLASAAILAGQVREHPAGQELDHGRYIRVVPEAESPVHKVYVKTRDGLYAAMAVRKPKGDGPFPALVYFHGAPGGRGMEKLVSWSLGTTGGPIWERFLQEGFVVAVADYRNSSGPRADIIDPEQVTYVDDGVAVVEHLCTLPFVDKQRIGLYGVSRGGNLVLHLMGRVPVRAAILGAAAPVGFLGIERVTPPPGGNPLDRYRNVEPDMRIASKNIQSIQAPVLILVGTADSLLPPNRLLYDLLTRAGKRVRMEIYEDGYHDFVAGPQGHEGRSEPLLEQTLDALEKSVEFIKQHTRK